MWVAIIGSRDYPWGENIKEAVAYLCEHHPGWKLVSGGARGVDSWAADAARKRGVEVLELLANWDVYGKSAGIIRNKDIVARADLVIAFWDGKSPGTKHAVGLARVMGKQVIVVGV